MGPRRRIRRPRPGPQASPVSAHQAAASRVAADAWATFLQVSELVVGSRGCRDIRRAYTAPPGCLPERGTVPDRRCARYRCHRDRALTRGTRGGSVRPTNGRSFPHAVDGPLGRTGRSAAGVVSTPADRSDERYALGVALRRRETDILHHLQAAYLESSGATYEDVVATSLWDILSIAVNAIVDWLLEGGGASEHDKSRTRRSVARPPDARWPPGPPTVRVTVRGRAHRRPSRTGPSTCCRSPSSPS